MAQKVTDALAKKFGDAIEATSNAYGDEVVTVKANKLVEIATYLRDDPSTLFDCPVFCTAIDRLVLAPTETDTRFEVCYQLRSMQHRHRIRLKVIVSGKTPKLPSLSGLWPAFNWQERETYDMYGIDFEGHPDLRRIFLYDEFVGYPLRKDYPKDKRQPLVRRDPDEYLSRQ